MLNDLHGLKVLKNLAFIVIFLFQDIDLADIIFITRIMLIWYANMRYLRQFFLIE